jgi:hypothetical protein
MMEKKLTTAEVFSVLGLSEQGFCAAEGKVEEFITKIDEFATLTAICGNLGIEIADHPRFRGQQPPPWNIPSKEDAGGPAPRDQRLNVEPKGLPTAAPRATDADAEKELSQAERDYCKAQLLSPARFLEAKQRRGGKASMSVIR